MAEDADAAHRQEALTSKTFDAIVLGTGLKESIVATLLAKQGKSVLHLDRNNYYGGESASLTLDELYALRRGPGGPGVPASLAGTSNEWALDVIPKLVMADGAFTQALVSTGVHVYLEDSWKQTDGSYVARPGGMLSGGGLGVYKVPGTAGEAAVSPLLGFFEKGRARDFLAYVHSITVGDPSTYGDMPGLADGATMRDVYDKFQLGEDLEEFVGHSLALHNEDSYVDQAALPTLKRIQLYRDSLARFGESPFLYPDYGLGTISESFSRSSARYGTKYILNTPIDNLVFGEGGVVEGVVSGGITAKSSCIICDPSYAPADKKVAVGSVVRCTVIMDHPPPNTDGSSCMLVIPQKRVGRSHDIYVMCLSSRNMVCAPGTFVAVVSTMVETGSPEAELQPGLDLLGDTIDNIYSIEELWKPAADGTDDKLFVSTSYDACSHLEEDVADVFSLYQRITGEALDLSVAHS